MNKTILMGRLVKDIELKYTANNTAVCNFTLAVNDRFKKDETDFISCVAWNKTAEFMDKYLGKGRQIIICGRIKTRNYPDPQNEGKKIYITEVISEEVNFADSKPQNDDVPVYDDGVDDLPFK